MGIGAKNILDTFKNPGEIAANVGTGGLYGIGKGVFNSLENVSNPSYNAQPYQRISPQYVDPTKLNQQISQYGHQQKEQNVNAFNAGLASQHGVNPALAARLIGNNTANANQHMSQNINQLQAQQNFGAQQFNAQQQMMANQLNSQNYNAAMGYNQQSAEAAKARETALLGGLIGGVAQGGAAALMSDARLKESPTIPPNNTYQQLKNPFLDELQKPEIGWHDSIMIDNIKNEMISKQINAGQKSQQKQEIQQQPQHQQQSKKFVVTSDENAKTKLKPATDDVSDMFDHIPSHYFQYKQGSVADDGGKVHAGVMAQDVEKSGQVGKDMVLTDPNTGYKMIDIPSATSALLASISEHHEKIGDLEKKIESLMKGSKKK